MLLDLTRLLLPFSLLVHGQIRSRRNFVKFVELRLSKTLLAENVRLDPVRSNLAGLVLHMRASGHSEDIIQLLKRALLRLRQPEEDHPEREEVKTGVEAERSRTPERAQHTWERKSEDGCPEVVCCHCPGHSDFTMREREDLCRICERYWALSRAIEDVKEVNKEGDHSEMGVTAFRNVEAEARSK